MACSKIRMQSLPKMANIEVANNVLLSIYGKVGCTAVRLYGNNAELPAVMVTPYFLLMVFLDHGIGNWLTIS